MKPYEKCKIRTSGFTSFHYCLIARYSCSQVLCAEETITMAFTIDPSESVTFTFYDSVYTEAFHRLGIEFNYVIYPPARASAMADSGLIDGEALRNRDYNDIYTNLVPVEESIFALSVHAYVINPEISLDSWESFRGTGYKVEYYRSARLVRQKLGEVVEDKNLSVANEHIHALNRLKAGRIDVYVESSAALAPLLESPEFKDSGIRSEATLMVVDMYSFLNRKHAGLARELAGVLRQMKEEGLVEEYRRDAGRKFADTADSKKPFLTGGAICRL